MTDFYTYLPIVQNKAVDKGIYINIVPGATDFSMLDRLGLRYITLDNFICSQNNGYRMHQADEANKTDAALYGILHTLPTTPLYDWIAWVEAIIVTVPYINHWQVIQEPNYDTGIINHYGMWGLSNLDTYLAFLQAASLIIRYHNKNVTLGLSSDLTGREFFANLVHRDAIKYVDIVGIHYYPFHGQSYNIPADEFRAGKPIWLTETNLLCSGSESVPFYIAQEKFTKLIVNQAADKDISHVFYYGWNPGWRCGSDLSHNPYL